MRLPLRSRVVTDPHGVRWRVSVRWLPWQPRRRGSVDLADAGDAVTLGMPDGDVGGAGCAVALLLVALVLALPVVLFLLELVALVIVFVLMVLVAGALGLRTWTIEVSPEPGPGRRASDEAQVSRVVASHRGIRAADAAILALARSIERGEHDPSRVS